MLLIIQIIDPIDIASQLQQSKNWAQESQNHLKKQISSNQFNMDTIIIAD